MTETPSTRYPGAADELLFLPLGGAGEIGMNLNLYGFGGKWLMVDLGISFADESLPGVDLIMPDPAFIEERRDDLLGLLLTHAHEDHLGAVPYLWPRLRCPVYATPFTAAVLRRKLAEAELLDKVPIHEVPLGGRVVLGPFTVDFMSITHSIPEPNTLALRTAAGIVVHTGDWKFDPDPLIGESTDEASFVAVGDEGVLALVCDSTNVFKPGDSGSEAEVRDSLAAVVAGRPGRVAITTFASNVARLNTVAEVARRHDRHLVLVGRSLWRMVEAARETGYLPDFGPILAEDEAGHLPPDKVLYLCTGCQGEPRGAMARIASGEHRHVALAPGDTVIFSCKIIPGNEIAAARLHNRLAANGVEVITERDEFVHVSGHPGREEMARMYRWVRPRVAVPVHGEMRHLMEHAAFATALQVPRSLVVRNGQLLRLGPEPAEIVGEVPSGRLIVDGGAIVPERDAAVRQRQKLMHNGGAVVTVVADAAGRLVAPPALMLQGIAVAGDGTSIEAGTLEAVGRAVAALPASARQDDERLAEAARLAVRRALRAHSDKKPVVRAQVIRVAT